MRKMNFKIFTTSNGFENEVESEIACQVESAVICYNHAINERELKPPPASDLESKIQLSCWGEHIYNIFDCLEENKNNHNFERIVSLANKLLFAWGKEVRENLYWEEMRNRERDIEEREQWNIEARKEWETHRILETLKNRGVTVISL